MALRIINSGAFHSNVEVLYGCDHAGDELPLHSHLFNHTTRCLAGEIEIFDETGPRLVLRPDDAAVEYIAGRQHGIRALTDGARFLNVSPILGYEEEARGQ